MHFCIQSLKNIELALNAKKCQTEQQLQLPSSDLLWSKPSTVSEQQALGQPATTLTHTTQRTKKTKLTMPISLFILFLQLTSLAILITFHHVHSTIVLHVCLCDSGGFCCCVYWHSNTHSKLHLIHYMAVINIADCLQLRLGIDGSMVGQWLYTNSFYLHWLGFNSPYAVTRAFSVTGPTVWNSLLNSLAWSGRQVWTF